MFNKKIFAVLLALTMILSSTVMAFATTPSAIGYQGADTATAVTNTDSTVEVYLQVEPLDLKATVTLSSYFQIDPNVAGNTAFVTPTLTAKNDTTAPLRFSVVSLKATGTAPLVVVPDKYTAEQWNNLGVADTKGNIALGFKNPAASPDIPSTINVGDPAWTGFWLADEATQAETALFDVAGGASRQFEMQGKFGRAWDAAYAFKYNCVMKVSLT